MTAEQADAFLDEVAAELVLGAPEEVRAIVLADDGLRGALLRFREEARDGLLAVAAGASSSAALERALRARKTDVVAAGSAHAYTVERLASRALATVVARAREVEAARRSVD